MNLKQEIIELINKSYKSSFEVEMPDFSALISQNEDRVNGDFSLPCFSLAKLLRLSPIGIAQKLLESLPKSDLLEKAEVINGYLNFFVNSKMVVSKVLIEFQSLGNKMFVGEDGKGKTICIDYSSANLAKYMHIGHLSTTILGESIARLYDNFGYKTVRMNYVGDYGTPWGKMIEGYKLWGNDNDIKARGVGAIQDLYIEFCKHEDEDGFMDRARETFKKIEEKDPETLKIYNWFVNVSKEENEKLTSLFGIKFDDWRGENYYSEKMQPVIDELKANNLLTDGENGSKIVDLGDMGVSVVQKSDGTSLYSTRDLATACDRFNEYQFDKCLYVTDISQKLHFAQFFEILKRMGKPFAENLEHIYYGRIRLPEGKISSRLGKQALLKDIVDVAYQKALEVIENRNLENKEEIAKKVAIGAVALVPLKIDKLKDTTFDIEASLNFDGETSPYIQYTLARINSIFRKAEAELNITLNDVKNQELVLDEALLSPEAFEIIKYLNGFKGLIWSALEKHEPSIITKRVFDICKAFNKFYQGYKVLDGKNAQTLNRLKLLDAIRQMLKHAMHLICVPTIEKM